MPTPEISLEVSPPPPEQPVETEGKDPQPIEVIKPVQPEPVENGSKEPEPEAVVVGAKEQVESVNSEVKEEAPSPCSPPPPDKDDDATTNTPSPPPPPEDANTVKKLSIELPNDSVHVSAMGRKDSVWSLGEGQAPEDLDKPVDTPPLSSLLIERPQGGSITVGECLQSELSSHSCCRPYMISHCLSLSMLLSPSISLSASISFSLSSPLQ
ncbi:unnamed protein product [Oncorhynchus mykiss]|uniref:Uncharacterized protein n=1 Tax=Oncorhynchus mykiss TaxID=8022 RepID=A0A060WBF0_ONCMY|nr:unnamed protein product [Oncorhynchus mykiss]